MMARSLMSEMHIIPTEFVSAEKHEFMVGGLNDISFDNPAYLVCRLHKCNNDSTRVNYLHV